MRWKIHKKSKLNSEKIWKIFFKKMDESELGVETMNYSKVSLYIILLSAYVPYFKRIEFL